MKISEIVLFAYATKGEALEVANAAEEDLCVASIVITKGNGFKSIAQEPVAYIVVPEEKPTVIYGSSIPT